MIFFVVEFQSSDVGGVIPLAYTDRADAEAKYHELLAVAAKSQVRKHGVMLCNEDLFILKSELYTHEEPEPNT